MFEGNKTLERTPGNIDYIQKLTKNGKLTTPTFQGTLTYDERIKQNGSIDSYETLEGKWLITPTLKLLGNITIERSRNGQVVVQDNRYEEKDATPPVKKDTTAPTTPVIGVFMYAEGTKTFQADWTSADPESGIKEYQYAIGTSKDANDTFVGWGSTKQNSISYSVSTMPPQDGKTYYLSVKAINNEGLISGIGSSNGVTIKTKPVNHPPKFDALSSKTIKKGENFTAMIKAYDSDKDILTYSVINLPKGATFGKDQMFSWTPAPDQGSSTPVNITFKVTDGKGGEASHLLTIVVTDVPIPILVIPAAPSHLNARSYYDYGKKLYVRLEWADNSNNETGFKIERASDIPRYPLLYKQIAKVTNMRSYVDYSVLKNTSYLYRVRAYNQKGDSWYSAQRIVRTLE